MRKLYLGEAKEITIDKETEIELGLRKNKIKEVIETLTKIPHKMDYESYEDEDYSDTLPCGCCACCGCSCDDERDEE